MRRETQIAVVLAIIVIVAAVFILPTIDLQPTALRSMRAAQVIFGSFALSAALCADFSISLPVVGFAQVLETGSLRPFSVLDLTCTLLC
jgi:hypothetical protein